MTDRKTLHSLEVLSVTREDAGQYSAYISNSVGAAYSSARLLVRGGCWVPLAGLRASPQSPLCAEISGQTNRVLGEYVPMRVFVS